ncbi:hypothetical protein KUL25_19320 [Rhodobacteraceae bacterium N5(2021)]|uniref:Uncharacterized protein n=1 Tax=Gymnodinialimonas phycosphaerae TaxID=2841589 RepID=A0A975YFK1_9RHOB|nr:hypothetical protein [Gymnodinialimonas phycosphaerae]MBY4894914.1 hypothetical protein [Gymnodinialimonas phycosphaerae]
MRKDTESLLEHVLAAVMAPDNDALTLATTLRNSVPEEPAIAVIRALLSADRVIIDTFNGSGPNRIDAQLARSLALTLAVATDDLSHVRDANPILLGDVLL